MTLGRGTDRRGIPKSLPRYASSCGCTGSGTRTFGTLNHIRRVMRHHSHQVGGVPPWPRVR